jgi:hypothetical protein
VTALDTAVKVRFGFVGTAAAMQPIGPVPTKIAVGGIESRTDAILHEWAHAPSG